MPFETARWEELSEASADKEARGDEVESRARPAVLTVVVLKAADAMRSSAVLPIGQSLRWRWR